VSHWDEQSIESMKSTKANHLEKASYWTDMARRHMKKCDNCDSSTMDGCSKWFDMYSKSEPHTTAASQMQGRIYRKLLREEAENSEESSP
jgi:hypothetical protein